MKRILKITVLVLVYLLFSGRSCQEDQEDLVQRQVKEAEAQKESIRSEVETDYLSEDSKFAVEMAAIQKVNDLADYIEVYTDVSLDIVFREKAGDMIRDIFVSDDVRLSFGPYRNKKIKYLTVKKFLDRGFGKDVLSALVLFDDITIDIPLNRSGPELYEGAISGIQEITWFTSSDTIKTEKTTITITIQASREIKVFGEDTLKTWAVNLGDMIETN
jgi:hypothetical protein